MHCNAVVIEFSAILQKRNPSTITAAGSALTIYENPLYYCHSLYASIKAFMNTNELNACVDVIMH